MNLLVNKVYVNKSSGNTLYEGVDVNHLENRAFKSFFAEQKTEEELKKMYKRSSTVVQPTSVKAGEVSYGILLCTHQIKGKEGAEPVNVLTIMPLSDNLKVKEHFRYLLCSPKPRQFDIVQYTYSLDGKTTIYLNQKGTKTPNKTAKIAAIALCNFDKVSPSICNVAKVPRLRNYRLLQLPDPQISYYDENNMKADYEKILENVQHPSNSSQGRLSTKVGSFLRKNKKQEPAV